MVMDKILLLLFSGSTFLGGLILLSLCAYQVQVRKMQMKLQLEEEKKRKKKLIEDPPPIEVS